MSIRKIVSPLLLMLGLTLLCGQTFAAEFSADILLQQPSESLTVKLYVKGELYRVQHLEGKDKFLAIENRVTNVTTALNPEEKTYKEIDGYAGAFVNPVKGWEAMTASTEEKPAGEETINGFVCQHFIYNYEGQTDKAFEAWKSEKLGFFMKCIAYYGGDQGTGTMQLTNIVEGPQEDSLFVIPAGYTRQKTPEEIELERPAITSKGTGEAPTERRVASGGELFVKTDPSLSTYIKMDNLIKDTSTCRVHFYKKGQKIDFSNVSPPQPEEFTLQYKGSRAQTMCGPQDEADEVRIKVTRGRVRVTAYNEYSSFDDTTRKQYYVAPPGRSITTAKGRGLKVKIVGDSPTGEKSTGHFYSYRREYVGGREELGAVEGQMFELENGLSRTFDFAVTTGVNYIKIELDEGGGLKLFTEQPPKE